MKEVLKYLQEYTEKLKDGIPGFISAGVLDFSGNIMAVSKTVDDVSVELEAPLQLEVVKAAANSLEVSELNQDNLVKDITIESNEVLYFISISEDRKLLVVVMLDAKEANVGLTRSFIINEKGKIAKKIAKHL